MAHGSPKFAHHKFNVQIDKNKAKTAVPWWQILAWQASARCGNKVARYRSRLAFDSSLDWTRVKKFTSWLNETINKRRASLGRPISTCLEKCAQAFNLFIT